MRTEYEIRQRLLSLESAYTDSFGLDQSKIISGINTLNWVLGNGD